MPSVIAAGTTSGTSLNLSGDTSGVLQFQTNGVTPALTIDTSQNVGIGTASPVRTLDVNGNMRLGAANGRFIEILNASSEASYISQESSAELRINQSTSSANSKIAFLTQGSERMRIDSSGNVGIGLINPSQRVDVSGNIKIGNTTSQPNLIFNNTSSGSWKSELLFMNGNDGKWAMGVDIAANGNNNFYWYDSVNATERMRLSNTGNLGIGTNNPTQAIHVARTGTAGLIMSSIGGGGNWEFGSDSSGNGYIYSGQGKFIQIATSGAERFRINADGYSLWNTASPNFSTIGNGNVMYIRGSMVMGIDGFGDAIGFGLVSRLNPSAAGGNGWPLYCLNGSGTNNGGIYNTTSTTSFQTSSDYRLKENQELLTGSGAFIDALQPKTWTWKSTGQKGVGFIAHEVQEVSPSSVIGKKDDVDEKGKPKYQSMEYGSAEFMANIIAELKDLRKRVALLESKN